MESLECFFVAEQRLCLELCRIWLVCSYSTYDKRSPLAAEIRESEKDYHNSAAHCAHCSKDDAKL